MAMEERAHVARGLNTDIQKVTLGMGAIFLVVGIFGFVPGITTNYQSMAFAGHDSEAMLLGYFQVSILHNVVHLLYGIAGLIMCGVPTQARNFLLGGGAIYLVLWVYGLIFTGDNAANFIPVNTADNWLHFGLGVVMIAVGVLLTRTPDRRDDEVPG
jgi:hypothetical protein